MLQKLQILPNYFKKSVWKISNFCENSAKILQKSQILPNFVKFQKFQLDNLVDFEKCCKTRIFLQRSAPIQPKTSEILPKMCQQLSTILRVGAGVAAEHALLRGAGGRAAAGVPTTLSSGRRHDGRSAKFRQNVARFRLYRHRFLQENMRFSAFFEPTRVSGWIFWKLTIFTI